MADAVAEIIREWKYDNPSLFTQLLDELDLVEKKDQVEVKK